MKKTLRILQFTALAIGLFTITQSNVLAEPCEKKSEQKKNAEQLQVVSAKNKYGHHALTVQIVINAPPNLVWEAIRENRLADPDVQYSKFTAINETERMLEQKYTSLPIFGATTCTLRLEEELHKRIDYNLIKSDRLSEFEGSWVLSPSEDQHSTTLELSNHLKLNIPVPQRLIDAFAAPKMKTRVMWVKNLAENKNKMQIASRE
jgi:hypothetical protein